MWTHAEIIRRQGSLAKVSAFPYEGLYSDFKRQYCDGTFNKPKQVRHVQDLSLELESVALLNLPFSL